MADTNPNPAVTPPAAAIDNKQLAETIQAAVLAATKPLAEQIADLKGKLSKIEEKPAAAKDDPKSKTIADGGAVLTAADVAKIVADSLKLAMDTDATDARRLAARQSAIDTELKGVPAVYHAGLPRDTDDAATLQASAKRLAEQYRADLAAAGVKAPNIGAAPGADAKTVGGAVDTSKMSSVQKISLAYQPAK